MYPLTTEKRNREQKNCFSFQPSLGQLAYIINVLYIHPRFLSSLCLCLCPLFLYCTFSLGRLYVSTLGYEFLWAMYYMISTVHLLLLALVHMHTTTVQGHQFSASKPTHLGRLGGGAFEYTVVVWPQASAWLGCQHLYFCSSGQSSSRRCQSPGYTVFLYLQAAAK